MIASPRRLLIAGNLLLAAGALFLAAPAAHVVTAWRAQTESAPSAPVSLVSRPRRPAEGEALGRLEVPRLGVDLVVFEGMSDAVLLKGPGHLPSSAWPGSGSGPGNCVIAGHRDSFFRRFAGAREDDLVRLHGPTGVRTYRLAERRIVRPEEISAVAPTADARLTLITCYPFRWVGAAPYRLVWSALPVDER